MASNEKRRDKSGEMQSVTTWFRITLWGNQAENAAKYLTKGSPVYIEGRLRVEEWTDRDNNNRYTLEVNATDMQFISSRGDNAGGGAEYSGPGDDMRAYSGGSSTPSGSSSPRSASQPTPVPDADDDIPF